MITSIPTRKTSFLADTDRLGLKKSCLFYLSRWNIDPDRLEKEKLPNNNGLLYSLRDEDGNKIAVKITIEFETTKRLPIENTPLILTPLRHATIGYDPGGAAIIIEIFPFMRTKGVEPGHVEALCRELYTKYQLLFRDNKPENVGLSENGMPYVIDSSSIIPVKDLQSFEKDKPFYYPQFSGYSAADGQWKQQPAKQRFSWPTLRDEIPEYEQASAIMQSSPKGSLFV